jgi:hypothetical protein
VNSEESVLKGEKGGGCGIDEARSREGVFLRSQPWSPRKRESSTGANSCELVLPKHRRIRVAGNSNL